MTAEASLNGLTRLLVANRGEIALRIMRTARRLGIETVAVYSDADRYAAHVEFADHAVHIGASNSADSYLNIDAVIGAAKNSGADAVHPGYGFLAENPALAQACDSAGLLFVGPDVTAIELMGSKRLAKVRMLEAGVPCVPGFQGEDASDETLIEQAREIGLPVMIKASAGGGGRGMRRVSNDAELAAAIRSARSEASNAFGSGELIIEKAVDQARHVEIQVFGDRHGQVIHLGERDCSIQRRHQKVVEEAPSPAVDDALRDRMGQAAVLAAATIDYVGAGTVEFLLGADGEFYFMEMNTRLQVEHPVTEAITGLDLVELQLRIAAGEPLPLSQNDLAFNGHAIEVRICAESPSKNFLPQTGPVLRWDVPEGVGLRMDDGIRAGGEISRFYDSMAAKLVAWGETREIARQRLAQALLRTRLHGVPSNLDFLHRIVTHEDFRSGQFDTAFIEQNLPQKQEIDAPTDRDFALAGLTLYVDDAERLRDTNGMAASLSGWYSSHPCATPLTLSADDQKHEVNIAHESNAYAITVDDLDLRVSVTSTEPGRIRITENGQSLNLFYTRRENELWLTANGRTASYADLSYAPVDSADAAGDGMVRAPSDGRLIEVSVAADQRVQRGDTLAVLESMKMEIAIPAPCDAVVAALHVASGDQVAGRQLLVELIVDET